MNFSRRLYEPLRKLAVYPRKLLQTFEVTEAARFLYAYASHTDVICVQTRSSSDGVWLRPRSSDIRVLYELFTLRELEMDWPLPKAPLTIIDGGANVGYATVAFKRRWPEAFVLAVEPDPENFAILRKNCSEFDRVELLQTGIWGTQCTLRVRPDTAPDAWGLQFEPVPENTPRGVRGETIPALIDRLPGGCCDILKLDIEGAESNVFLQLDLAWIERVAVILIETHGRAANTLVRDVARRFAFETTQTGEKLMLWRRGESHQRVA